MEAVPRVVFELGYASALASAFIHNQLGPFCYWYACYNGHIPRLTKHLWRVPKVEGDVFGRARLLEAGYLTGVMTMKGQMRGAARMLLRGGVHLVPLLPEENFVSVFDRKLREIHHPDGREFIRQTLLMIKKALSAPETRKGATRLLDFMIRQLFDVVDRRKAFEGKYGFSPPVLMVISPSMRCNLRCYGCYAGEYNKGDDLDAKLLNRVVNEARDMGIAFITISGGEPFFSEDVLQLWENHPDIFFQVYTNGTLIDEPTARSLAKLGNVFPAISVEGFEKETDARRGPGTYAKIMAAMKNLRNEGVLFGFSATATRNNNELISSDEFVDYYIQRGCFMGWYFNYIPIGRKPDMNLMPTPEQRIHRWRRIRELRQTKPILLSDFWCDGSLVGGCLAGGRCYLHISNKGYAEPCVFAHFAADNIKDKSLPEILGSPFFRAIRSRQPYSQNLLRPCMIIDNPEVLRETVAVGGAVPTHPGAETIITDLAASLDAYAREYAKVADPAWTERCQCMDQPKGKEGAGSIIKSAVTHWPRRTKNF